jgi:ABC-type amino acid transport substrate-binding protein
MRDGSMRAGLVLVLLAVLGCEGPAPRQAATRLGGTQGMLRVGVSPDAPPVVFRREGRIVGVEPDLAQALADQSRQSVALVPMTFDELIPALLDRRIDIIMSGMTVTPARQVRVAFGDPYMHSGLLPACKRDQASNYASRDAIVHMGGNVGVRMGSTAESWAQANLQYANVATYPSILDAAREMAQGRLDLILSDAPQVAWAVSEHAGMLQVLRILLTHEEIAWAFRPEDTRLREAANAALATMRSTGRLHTILQRWIPFLDQLERAR